jgi:hypothetical protein
MSRKAARKPRRGDKDFAEKITFNPPQPRGRKRFLAQEGVLTDEDRTGRIIGRFGGAGQFPLSKD